MATFFLILIYLTFIGLGLPDSLLGAVWPVMRGEMTAALGTAGIVSMIVSGGTILSSLASEKTVGRFGAGKVTAVSVAATAIALLGFSQAPSLAWLVALSVPLGLGAGAVDAALNNYVALHYQAKHMNWLHCFWGVGAFTGPMILAWHIQHGHGWRPGYLAIGIVQAGISALLFATLGLWGKVNRDGEKMESARSAAVAGNKDLPKMPARAIPGVPFALAAFLCYCAIEFSTGLWSASFLVEMRGVSETWAARGAATFYGSITVGRFLSGFLTRKFSGPQLIRFGVLAILSGGLLLFVPAVPVAFAGLAVIGLGCAPVYPGMIHETPRRFGAANSQKVVGLQMAVAYCGTTFVPPALGYAAQALGLGVFPFAVTLIALVLLALSEAVEKAVGKKKPA